jgi:hypothetical protein
LLWSDFLDGALVLRSKLLALTSSSRTASYDVTLLITAKPNPDRDKQMLAFCVVPHNSARLGPIKWPIELPNALEPHSLCSMPAPN